MNKQKTIGKQCLINILERKGYGISEAKTIVDVLMSEMREEVLKGSKINLHNICTITPVIKPSKEMPVMGGTKHIPERMRLVLKMSSTLDKDFKTNHSSEAKKKDVLKMFSQNLGK